MSFTTECARERSHRWVALLPSDVRRRGFPSAVVTRYAAHRDVSPGGAEAKRRSRKAA